MKLGKLAPKFNPKTLKMAKFLSPSLPNPPTKVYREYKIPNDQWGMYANDTVGDCTCAAVAHLLMLVTAHTGTMITPELKEVLAMYSAITGYDPTKTDANGDNPTDTGAAVTDVLNYWQTTGLSGHKILGWAEIDYTNLLKRQQGVWLFGGLDVGIQLPNSAMSQFEAGSSWSVVPKDGGIAGGHCILEAGYGRLGEDYVSWGNGYQKASRAWSNRYIDECYVVFTPDWIEEASGLTPSGFNKDQLMEDLKDIA